MEAAIAAGVTAMASSTTAVLTTNIPVVFAVFGGLVALGIALRLIGRTIGRKA